MVLMVYGTIRLFKSKTYRACNVIRMSSRDGATVVLLDQTYSQDETEHFTRAGISCHRVSVRPSVRLSHAGTVSKRLIVGSRKQRHTETLVF